MQLEVALEEQPVRLPEHSAFQLGLVAQPVALVADSRAAQHWPRRRLSPVEVDTVLSAEEGQLAVFPAENVVTAEKLEAEE